VTEDIEATKIVVVKALIRNEEGKFLALRESKDRDKHTAGKWEIPGGRLKVGEGRFEAARREVKEELNIDVENPQDVVRIEVESNHLVSCYIVAFEEFHGEPEIRLDEKHSEHRWVTPEEFMQLDWHSDAGYDIVPMKHLDDYLKRDNIY
jgi:8-oxo-dGTP diphosphatase